MPPRPSPRTLLLAAKKDKLVDPGSATREQMAARLQAAGVRGAGPASSDDLSHITLIGAVAQAAANGLAGRCCRT